MFGWTARVHSLASIPAASMSAATSVCRSGGKVPGSPVIFVGNPSVRRSVIAPSPRPRLSMQPAR